VRSVLRKSVPFVGAVLIGLMIAAALAGVAFMVSHS